MKTVLSVEEFEKLPEPEQGGGYELDEGEPVYVSPNSFEQAEIIQRIYASLKTWAQAGNRGLVAADTWFQLAPGVVRAPDVAYVPRDRISNLDPKHALKLLPALAVEVLSPLNTAREVSRKIQQYRDAGIELIWVVDLDKCEVDVYSPLPLMTLRQGDTLRDDKILPGFSLPLSLVFEPVR
ncbi:MAG: Uma2 family endonuclease [Terriglobia bacterium]